MQNELDRIKSFIVHGAYFTGERGNQVYGECPFCGGKDKFHVNKDNLLWDCKKCGRSGNLNHFLEEINLQNIKDLDKAFFEKLCIDRKLPREAFKEVEVGRSGLNYTFPIRDHAGRIQDIRMYRPGRKVIGTANCSTGLIGLHHLRKSPENWPIYLCEGDWDYMAMRWHLKFLNKPGVALGVPGAPVFKKEWVRHFEGRTVYVLYDNDDAGENGELLVKQRLTNCAKTLKYIHWSNKLPSGYDIRDLIVHEAIQKKKPVKTYKAILAMLQDVPRKSENPNPEAKLGGSGVEMEQEEVPPVKTLEDVHKMMGRWLFLRNYDAIDAMLAVVASHKIEGDPLWMFLVAPPGGAKTEIISSLSTSPDIYFTSSLTPHALISGASWTEGADPSLIPKLDGKVLAIKDFTTILSKRDIEKEEIYGILRDAYDGKCSKVFGNGIIRNYESRFTILSAVTPEIYNQAHQHSLGERFLKLCIGTNLVHNQECDIIDRAITNLNRETTMRKDMAAVVRAFLYHKLANFKAEDIPAIGDEMKRKIIALSMFCARMRGTVSRDRYRPDMIASKPSAEIGSRVGKQLAKYAVSMAFVRGKKEVTESEYTLVRKVALDTISQRNEDILRSLIVDGRENNNGEYLKTKQLSSFTRYPHSTISRILADMQMLDIVKRTGSDSKFEWRVTDYMKDLVDKAGLYRIESEKNRPKVLTLQPVKTFKKKL